MQTGQPRQTAQRAAAHRAAHQLLEDGRIFQDSLAVPILGESPGAIAREATANPERRGMRLFIAARTRFAESAVAGAFQRGVRQLVVLGDPGLYRRPRLRKRGGVHLQRSARVHAGRTRRGAWTPSRARRGVGRAVADLFTPANLHARLRDLGFNGIEDLGPAEVAILYLGAPAGSPERKGGHLIRAQI